MSTICRCTLDRQVVPDLVGPYGLLSRNVAPAWPTSSTFVLLEQPELVAGDEVGVVDEIGASGSARGPKRRCDTVTEPDFFES